MAKNIQTSFLELQKILDDPKRQRGQHSLLTLVPNANVDSGVLRLEIK